ncbi:unnamed protein product [Gongylonema pulchrum]|uniref:RLAN domain-containing protein n=1 Tax=Gongylonema pulchrum TaxID=637853 RepID=A0A183CXW7_9BILA|nr:unnamed protein product [Gongylonema pulchrum]
MYVIVLESRYAWVRLCDGDRPPSFAAATATIKALKALELKELIPGTPCIVSTRFHPLDFVNDGISYEQNEPVINCDVQFESYARAIVEEYDSTAKTASVRLVDFGIQLFQIDVTQIKPLISAFGGPPLAVRLQIDVLPQVLHSS